MPRNASGTYTLPTGTLAVTGTTIESEKYNNFVNDAASALTGSVPRDGSAGMSAPLAMGGNKVTGLADGTSATDAATKGQVDDVASGLVESGSVLLFAQTTAPAGFTKVTTYNDYSLRVVNGTASFGGSVAFSTLFGRTATDGTAITQAHLPVISFTNSLTAATHTHGATLTAAVSGTTDNNLLGHTHSVSGTTGNNSVSHTHSYVDRGDAKMGVNYASAGGNNPADADQTSSYTTGANSADHTHSFSATSGSESVHHGHTFTGAGTATGTSDASGALSVTGTVSSGGSNTAHTHGLDTRVKYVDVILASKD